MTKETYDKAEEIVSEIVRINQLIDYISGDANETWSDTKFLANLLGIDEVTSFLRVRLKALETLLAQL